MMAGLYDYSHGQGHEAYFRAGASSSSGLQHQYLHGPDPDTASGDSYYYYDQYEGTYSPNHGPSDLHLNINQTSIQHGQHGDYSQSQDPQYAETSEISPTDNGNGSYMKFTTDKSVGLISLVADNILSHPFLVLRRQCQVHVNSRRYHLSPFTLVYPVFHICQRQGGGVLWKGLGSSLLIRGMTMAVEDVLSKVTPLPNEISRHSSLKSVSQHILLKAISLTVITPFYSASLVETAQSEVASDTAGFFDVFREGLRRLLSWPSTGRLVPLHTLVLPTVGYGLLSYLIYTGIRSVSLATIRRVRESKERRQGAVSKEIGVSIYGEMTASLIGHATADMLLFPLETVLHRLHLQGTRTIIDSLDCGYEVTPVITSYNGLLDCVRSTIEEEGLAGLYKGFGALILQYGLQILLIRMVKIVIEKSPFGPTSTSGNGALSTSLVMDPALQYPNVSTSDSLNISSGVDGHTQVPGMRRLPRPSSSQQNYRDVAQSIRRPGYLSDSEGTGHSYEPKLRSPYTHYSP